MSAPLRRTRPVSLLLAACLAAATLAGCGKKGALEPPEGRESEFPRVYPKPEPGTAPAARTSRPPAQPSTDSLTLPPSQILPQ